MPRNYFVVFLWTCVWVKKNKTNQQQLENNAYMPRNKYV